MGRTFDNNGIQGEIEKRIFEPNEANTITATVIGNYKYVKFQKEPYYCSQNINKLTPKLSRWNQTIAYFIIPSIQMFVSQYNGQQSGYTLNDIKKHKIFLPQNESEDIDFDFMETFIAELKSQHMADLKSYLSVTGLKNYNLTQEEEIAIKKFNNIIWEQKKVPDVFVVRNTKSILSRDIEFNNGNIPYLSASSENNGITSYISYDENLIDEGNCVFIGGKTFVVSYQEEDFFSNDSHNLALYLQDNEHRNKDTQLFLATCIEKSLQHKYTWDDSISNTKIQKDNVFLPMSGEIVDFEFMNIFIRAVKKLVIKDVVIWANKT